MKRSLILLFYQNNQSLIVPNHYLECHTFGLMKGAKFLLLRTTTMYVFIFL